MDEEAFHDLLESVHIMGEHMSGKKLDGIRVTEFPEVEAKSIRNRVGVSQSEFARLIGVPVKTLQNWEQHRTSPTGPARTLLRMISRDPTAAMRLLISG
ncbi:MAG: helix-turn-helix domain-containing protein [Magnetococcales bacterium]|nr:helix-turn-helix domain-containing protein [Magnetococcales bacterium]MBF0321523.1 helix-turn-helix domain-containing protein [Magnetococcales bacterium]